MPKKGHIEANSMTEALKKMKRLIEYKDSVSYRITRTWDIHIDQFDKDGNFIRTWEGMSKIKSEGKYDIHGVKICIIGRIRTSQGYIWKYHEFNK